MNLTDNWANKFAAQFRHTTNHRAALHLGSLSVGLALLSLQCDGGYRARPGCDS